MVFGSVSNMPRPSYTSSMSASDMLIDMCSLFTPHTPTPSRSEFLLLSQKTMINTKCPKTIDPHPLLSVDHCPRSFNCCVMLFCCPWASSVEDTPLLYLHGILFIILYSFPKPMRHMRLQGSQSGADGIGGEYGDGCICIEQDSMVHRDEMSCILFSTNILDS